MPQPKFIQTCCLLGKWGILPTIIHDKRIHFILCHLHSSNQYLTGRFVIYKTIISLKSYNKPFLGKLANTNEVIFQTWGIITYGMCIFWPCFVKRLTIPFPIVFTIFFVPNLTSVLTESSRFAIRLIFHVIWLLHPLSIRQISLEVSWAALKVRNIDFS